MASSDSSTRSLVEMQGFVGLSDDELATVEPWLRFSPAIYAAWAATASWAGSPGALAALSLLALLGATLPHHPFDAAYNHGLRHFVSGPPIPNYGAPRRFACAVAAAWLAATATAFGLDAPAAGYFLGGLFTALALVPVLTGFCVPSFAFGAWRRWRRGASRRRMGDSAGRRSRPGPTAANRK